MIKNKGPLAILLVPTLLLLGLRVAMRFNEDIVWTWSDFVVAWVLMAGTGYAYRVATRRAGGAAYRAAAGLAVAAGFLLVWINLAVGVIGDEGNPANLLYAGVLVVGVAGALIARFEPQGMARALFATAFAQMLVPGFALCLWRPTLSFEMLREFVLNAVFVLMFAGSALLFRCASRQQSETGVEEIA